VSQPTDRNHGSQLTSFVAPSVSSEQVDQGPHPLDIQLNVTYFIQRRWAILPCLTSRFGLSLLKRLEISYAKSVRFFWVSFSRLFC